MQKIYSIREYYHILKDTGLVTEYNILEAKDVQYVTYDSKKVKADTMFICKGVTFKEQYLAEAVEKGCVCYVSEKKYDDITGVSYIIVSDIRKAMPYLAANFNNYAWKELKMTGITGTKGKSTTAYYVKAIVDDYLKASGKKESAIISSIDVYDGVENKESHITTPEAVELQEHFRNAVNSDIEFLEMEASSQALKYNRLDETRFDVGVFLNISEDHISPIEHPDFEDYFGAKLKMFGYCDNACVNLDSDFSERILKEASASNNIITFGTKIGADIYGYDIRKDNGEILFSVKCDKFDEEFRLGMPGLFNVENALAAIAVAYVYDIPLTYIKSGLLRARSSGRMELYTSKDKKIIAVVDYAHNKLSFEKLFETTLKEYPGYKIVAIFGCPGKKALLRRRDLGTVAGMYADKIYLVAEDPGEEPVIEISKDIAQYVEAQNCPYEMIEDRGEAIGKAIGEAAEKTVFLITGKGNETRQKYGREYIDCPTDVDYVKKYIAEYDKERCGSLGIIGGLGPAASSYFYQRIINRTDARSDQEHIDMIILNHASMPDRTAAIVSGDTKEVVKCFVDDAKKLEMLGVKNIAIPCNTSYAFYEEMQAAVNIPIINMASESIKYAIEHFDNVKNIGIMATDGTLKAEVYKKECDKAGVGYIVPSVDRQKDVMYIIYEEVKRGRKGSKKTFDNVVTELVKKGADAIILACTELSVYKEYETVPDICVDAMDVLVNESIKRSGYNVKRY